MTRNTSQSATPRLQQLLDRLYLGLSRPFGRRARARAMLDQRMSERPRLSPPPDGRVLVIAPHPDDESIGCGGTILAIPDRRERVACVLVTGGQAARPDWDRDQVRDTRRQEMQACLELFGLEKFYALPGVDQQLKADPASTAELRKVLQEFAPQAVLLPFYMDADHRHTNEMFFDAAQGVLDDATPIWAYEVWSHCPATAVVDITDHAAKKAQAIALHASQDRQMNYAQATLGLNAWRAMQVRQPGAARPQHAEAFLVLPLRQYREWAQAWLAQGAPRGETCR
jgi:LmbE family N-acetylglucosaminyl deacetylase